MLYLFGKIIGKNVLSIKGSFTYQNTTEPTYILFDDGETYIQLEEQDSYSFHDCSQFARTLSIRTDKERWHYIMTTYKDANVDI